MTFFFPFLSSVLFGVCFLEFHGFIKRRNPRRNPLQKLSAEVSNYECMFVLACNRSFFVFHSLRHIAAILFGVFFLAFYLTHSSLHFSVFSLSRSSNYERVFVLACSRVSECNSQVSEWKFPNSPFRVSEFNCQFSEFNLLVSEFNFRVSEFSGDPDQSVSVQFSGQIVVATKANGLKQAQRPSSQVFVCGSRCWCR